MVLMIEEYLMIYNKISYIKIKLIKNLPHQNQLHKKLTLSNIDKSYHKIVINQINQYQN
jgi:hypothetical protein